MFKTSDLHPFLTNDCRTWNERSSCLKQIINLEKFQKNLRCFLRHNMLGTFQERPCLRSLSTSLWQMARTIRHCFLHSCSLCSMIWCHSLQVLAALHRLAASSSPKILTLISVGSISAKLRGGAVPSAAVRAGPPSQRKNTGGVLPHTCCIIESDWVEEPEERADSDGEMSHRLKTSDF